MHHISTRAQLYEHVAQTTGDSVIRDNINHGHTTLWGRFVGGWVLETHQGGTTVIVGIKIAGAVGQTLISGRLSAVPWLDYIGGENGIDQGDHPELALARKRNEGLK